MAKVRPLPISVEAASKRESFTVWMKSLVMQGNGCTVFNENGEIVYRIDNYDNKGSNEVYLMDLRGNVLFTILRRVRVFGRLWRGYKGDNDGSNLNKEKPSFEVTKKGEITLLSNNEASCYKLKLEAASATGRTKSAALFKIIDCRRGVVVAEGMRKQSRSGSGVLLGDDVLTLSVEPHVDRSFIMALVVWNTKQGNEFLNAPTVELADEAEPDATHAGVPTVNPVASLGVKVKGAREKLESSRWQNCYEEIPMQLDYAAIS
ncbi:protein LURP-one-related 2 [Citrus sinensis]|uniref:Protein LURP-one-related 2 n=1 Tax=Citrus sinensis TaxID=2711 RepID=A0ACB8LQV3_CITSI|nr:protein LURP-one-related 2 [Citrus sinensis]